MAKNQLLHLEKHKNIYILLMWLQTTLRGIKANKKNSPQPRDSLQHLWESFIIVLFKKLQPAIYTLPHLKERLLEYD